MSWHHERVIDGFHEGTTLPRIRDYLVNEDGVRIEPIGARGFWVFKYTHGDLQIEFDAGSTTLSESDSIRFLPLGPECIVGLRGNAATIATLNRITKVQVAKNIVEALLAHHKLPTSTSPHVEKVIFNSIARNALGDHK